MPTIDLLKTFGRYFSWSLLLRAAVKSFMHSLPSSSPYFNTTLETAVWRDVSFETMPSSVSDISIEYRMRLFVNLRCVIFGNVINFAFPS